MTAEHVRMLPRREPADILEQAWREHGPSQAYVMFSGGKDSSVTLDLLWRHHRERITGALHINTGIAVPETRLFAAEFCKKRGIPFQEITTPVVYEDLVRKSGFPGAMSHRYMYINLKERALDVFIRKHKSHSRDRIALLTGVRYAESVRRMGTSDPVFRKGARVWVAPLVDFSNMDMHDYRTKYDVEMSEASRTLHMSGDCLCGAYASPGEMQMIETFHPDIAKRIHDLEASVTGQKFNKWGWQNNNPELQTAQSPGPLCVGCVGLFDGESV